MAMLMTPMAIAKMAILAIPATIVMADVNRGFNFSILPQKLDFTQTLVEFRKYERAAIWHEFHYGKEDNHDFEGHIFREEKTNMPKNYSIPEGLKTFLAAIKSEIQDPRNRNEVPCNIPQDELVALKELIHLQKERIFFYQIL